ncbi:MAG: hypothetical protein H6626_07130 [Pseudobdellovibrionaceae bacterium]|nr:MAG: hypothetical protein H6626_07130 [Pseudobdellovibrionaceae bacterium]
MDESGRAPKSKWSVAGETIPFSVHFRRCHHCGTLNQNEADKVEKCQQCGRTLAAFHYFDERLVPTVSDRHLRPPQMKNHFTPIQGLTVYWENY